jgi:hypothetical protein
MKEDAKWMWQVIASVRWFKISVYSSEKENDEMMTKIRSEIEDIPSSHHYKNQQKLHISFSVITWMIESNQRF